MMSRGINYLSKRQTVSNYRVWRFSNRRYRVLIDFSKCPGVISQKLVLWVYFYYLE